MTKEVIFRLRNCLLALIWHLFCLMIDRMNWNLCSVDWKSPSDVFEEARRKPKEEIVGRASFWSPLLSWPRVESTRPFSADGGHAQDTSKGQERIRRSLFWSSVTDLKFLESLRYVCGVPMKLVIQAARSGWPAISPIRRNPHFSASSGHRK